MTVREIIEDFHNSDFISFINYMNTYFYEDDKDEESN